MGLDQTVHQHLIKSSRTLPGLAELAFCLPGPRDQFGWEKVLLDKT
jgi:hypothetical protein